MRLGSASEIPIFTKRSQNEAKTKPNSALPAKTSMSRESADEVVASKPALSVVRRYPAVQSGEHEHFDRLHTRFASGIIYHSQFRQGETISLWTILQTVRLVPMFRFAFNIV